MKQLYILLLVGMIGYTVSAQSILGLTHKPDTSYTNYSAYKSTRASHPETSWVGEIADASITKKENIIYATTGKRKLRLDAFYPALKNKRNNIAILIIHGGGWRSGNRTQHHQLAHKLASLGYTCLHLNTGYLPKPYFLLLFMI